MGASSWLLMSLLLAGCGDQGLTLFYDTGGRDTGAADTGSTDTAADTGTDTAADTGTDTGTGADTGATDTAADTGSADTGSADTGSADTGSGWSYADRTLPPTYNRVTHSQGPIDFTAVAWAPDGTYALILGYPASLYLYDAGTAEVTAVGSASGESWKALAFSTDGTYALIGGGKGAIPTPVLYAYTEGGGLQAISDLIGTADGKLPPTSRIQALSARPGTGAFAVLSDNAASWPSQITYMNQVTPDLGGTWGWSFHGGANSDQGASSVAWGRDGDDDIALAVDNYLELFYFDPALTSGQFAVQSTPNTGNLRTVRFRPDGQVAWVLNWSGNGKVYTWAGVLRNDAQNSYAFGGWYRSTFDISPDGTWKVFVGSNGTVYFSDSPWQPIDGSRFHSEPIPSWDQPPWNGSSNDYLTGVAWRPGTCEGLLVGDATDAKGMIVRFSLH